MKVSASIYSTDHELTDIVKNLDEHQIDLFHVDCNDDITIFEDIPKIRQISSKPIDLHLITNEPGKYFDLIQKHCIEYVTFQFENLHKKLIIPENLGCELGLSITCSTDISVFNDYADRFSFILFMATTPGQSSGIFNKDIFKKIRQFQKAHPDKKIHVDGGINAEVSFILRNMGVYSVVSGSYLFNSTYLGLALLNLKSNEIESHFRVKDFMISKDEIRLMHPDQRTFKDVLYSIDENNLGFTMLVDKDGALEGIITNADVRKGLMKNIDDLNNVSIDEIINRSPVTVKEDFTVLEMLRHIKAQNFTISYIPVINNQNIVTGTVTFFNLIKGEL